MCCNGRKHHCFGDCEKQKNINFAESRWWIPSTFDRVRIQPLPMGLQAPPHLCPSSLFRECFGTSWEMNLLSGNYLRGGRAANIILTFSYYMNRRRRPTPCNSTFKWRDIWVEFGFSHISSPRLGEPYPPMLVMDEKASCLPPPSVIPKFLPHHFIGRKSGRKLGWATAVVEQTLSLWNCGPKAYHRKLHPQSNKTSFNHTKWQPKRNSDIIRQEIQWWLFRFKLDIWFGKSVFLEHFLQTVSVVISPYHDTNSGVQAWLRMAWDSPLFYSHQLSHPVTLNYEPIPPHTPTWTGKVLMGVMRCVPNPQGARKTTPRDDVAEACWILACNLVWNLAVIGNFNRFDYVGSGVTNLSSSNNTICLSSDSNQQEKIHPDSEVPVAEFSPCNKLHSFCWAHNCVQTELYM